MAYDPHSPYDPPIRTSTYTRTSFFGNPPAPLHPRPHSIAAPGLLTAHNHNVVSISEEEDGGVRTRPGTPLVTVTDTSANTVGTGLGGAGTGGTGGGGKSRDRDPRLAVAQAQIDETVGIMRGNLVALAERGEALSSLESRTESLVQSARGFRRSAQKVRRDMWWKDMKMRLIIGLVITVVISLTVLSIVQALRSKRAPSPDAHAREEDEGEGAGEWS